MSIVPSPERVELVHIGLGEIRGFCVKGVILIESTEIRELVSPSDLNVLRFNERTHAYEIFIPPSRHREFRAIGFVSEHGLMYTHSAETARRIPEWELLADPDTYARLKTK